MATCINCGAPLKDGDRFCPNCGALIPTKPEAATAEAPFQNSGSAFGAAPTPETHTTSGSYTEPNDGPTATYNASQAKARNLPKRVDFKGAVERFFKSYIEFNGRASRSEYWYWFLASFVISIGLNLLNSNTLIRLWSLVILLPGLGLCVRRLHDIGKAWTGILIVLVPIVGWVLFIVWMARPGEGDNQWGPCEETCEAQNLYSD